jgi:hypothetical protein
MDFSILRRFHKSWTRAGSSIGGYCDNVTATPLNSEPQAIYLQEDASLSMHRIEQIGIPVVANQSYTVDVVARARGRNRLMIEFRDGASTAYTRATYDLEQARVAACLAEDAVAIGAVDEDWVRCQLTLTPASDVAVFNVTLVDQEGATVYQGKDQAGIDIRPPVIGRTARTNQNSVGARQDFQRAGEVVTAK